jgi:hypothetical protein
VKCGKGNLAGLQSTRSHEVKPAQILENFGWQDFSNQRVSTMLNLNSDSDLRINGLSPHLV